MQEETNPSSDKMPTPTTDKLPQPNEDDSEDIDSETALNTVYNLLNELGDLNRTNRKVAEVLAGRFSSLQMQVNDAEHLTAIQHGSPHPKDPRSLPLSSTDSSSSGTYHTPPAAASKLESSATKCVQSDIVASDVSMWQRKASELETANTKLTGDIEMLVESHKRQQEMAREYERVLAAALKALRMVLGDRAKVIEEVQEKYTRLLEVEKDNSQKLEDENSRVLGLLNDTAAAIKMSIGDDDDDNGN